MPDSRLYGLLAEFDRPAALVAAARRARDAGFRKLDGFTPYPIEELGDALGHHSRGLLPRIVLGGGVLGALAGFGLQYWVAVIVYPINLGGKPLNSWPAFIPVTFEMTILFAALATVLGMLGLNGLPQPHHPLFNVPDFKLASRDRFFLCIEAADPRFDREATRKFLLEAGAGQVHEVAD